MGIEVIITVLIGIFYVSAQNKPEPRPTAKTEMEQCVKACESGVFLQYKACKCKENTWEYGR